MHAIQDGVIKGMYVMGENPAMSDPDVQHAREALAQLEHLVVQDIFLTETAWHADVVLPASAHAEKWGTFTNTNRQVQIGRPVLDPPGEARQDWELIQELAQRVGLDWAYKDVSRGVRRDGAGDAVAQQHHLGAAGARGRRHLSVRRAGQARQRDHLRRLGSRPPSGRAKIVPADLVPPDELPDETIRWCSPPAGCSSTGTPASMTRRASMLDALEPEAIAGLEPARDATGSASSPAA